MEHINGFKAAVAAVLGGLTALWGWFGWLVLAWLLCMALDYGTGTAAALRAGEWSSKVARDGLWHKLGAVVAVLVAAILDGVIGECPSAGLVYHDRAGEHCGEHRCPRCPRARLAPQGHRRPGVHRGRRGGQAGGTEYDK